MAGKAQYIVNTFIWQMTCHGCGVCVGKCPNDVIVIEDGVAVIGDGCVHCGKCIEVCPVVKFG